MNVSYSRFMDFSTCPQKHYYAWVKRIKPKRVERPLYFGIAFHELLELRFGEDGPIIQKLESLKNEFKELSDEEQENLGPNFVQDISDIFRDYRELYPINNDTIKPMAMEKRFSIKMGAYKGEPVYFTGIIDEVYKTDFGMMIGEHKTFSQVPELSTLVMNAQVHLYARALQKTYGELPKKVKWDYIKSRAATEPVWLEKSNRFSKAATTSVTPFSYNRALQSRGMLTKAEYNQSWEEYGKNIENFFFQRILDINPSIVKTVWRDFKEVAQIIVKEGDSCQRKCLTKDCSWCSFKALCYAEFTGADVNYIIQTDYKERESK